MSLGLSSGHTSIGSETNKALSDTGWNERTTSLQHWHERAYCKDS